MKTRRIVIIGAGGFAREVKWLLKDLHACGTPFEFLGYVVSDLDKLGAYDSRDEILGDLSWLAAHEPIFDALALGIGTPEVRLAIPRMLEEKFGIEYWPPLVHPSVRMDFPSCHMGHGAIVCAGTIGTVNVKIGPYALVNLACTLGHEAEIGAGCVLNPTVNISGGVNLGEGVLVGTGAQVLQYLRVGTGATVGAGAVVTKDVAPRTTVVGIPAKPR